MESIRYFYRFLRNSVFRYTAIISGCKLEPIDNILIISPHPDDEILGCGGLISRLNSEEKKCYIIFLTQGENSINKIDKKQLIIERRKLTERAMAISGQTMDRVYFFDYPDGNVSKNHHLAKHLDDMVSQISPSSIFVTHRFEGWNDHVQANIIATEMAKKMRIPLYEYCVWFWYTMPFSKYWKLNWRSVKYTSMSDKEHKNKIDATDVYVNEKSTEGLYYSGLLPKILITSCTWKHELYFKTMFEKIVES